ncbi:MAG: CDP-alcohol phosphatidyltransferase family protein [Chloroflexi bacterium]|nr:CDP-alcohol phosphatidyltransferase family protein [Chloroflexota bacterium]
MSGSLVTPKLRARVRGLAQPIARLFARLGLSPNQLTLIGFSIAILAGIAAARQAWLAAGLLVVFGGVFDLFDGALARFAGKVSKLGAFYDSVFDRWGEGVVYVGIAWGAAAAGFSEGAVLTTAALASAVMVSYARAKSESLGFSPGTRMANVGLAPREVRLAILAIGLVVTGYGGGVVSPAVYVCAANVGGCPDDGPHFGATSLAVSLGLITILATITTIQRILHVRAQAGGG